MQDRLRATGERYPRSSAANPHWTRAALSVTSSRAKSKRGPDTNRERSQEAPALHVPSTLPIAVGHENLGHGAHAKVRSRSGSSAPDRLRHARQEWKTRRTDKQKATYVRTARRWTRDGNESATAPVGEPSRRDREMITRLLAVA